MPIARLPYHTLIQQRPDDACIRQVSLQQSRQIIVAPEVQALVSGLLSVPENLDLREQVKHLLPSRLSGFIVWEDMAAEVSFFGVVEKWLTSWNG